jgi:hypothetical protein
MQTKRDRRMHDDYHQRFCAFTSIFLLADEASTAGTFLLLDIV